MLRDVGSSIQARCGGSSSGGKNHCSVVALCPRRLGWPLTSSIIDERLFFYCRGVVRGGPPPSVGPAMVAPPKLLDAL